MRVTINRQGAATDRRGARRKQAMVRVQTIALPLFEKRGFDAVSIEEIATQAEVGPATIYRAFGTKERIVLWDDYDPGLLAGFAAALPGRAVGAAMVHALEQSLAQIYAAERAHILRRARLMRRTPALQRAAGDDQRQLREALAALLLAEARAKHATEAAVWAGALAAALEAGINHWIDSEGKTPITRSLVRAFDALDRLGEVPAPSKRATKTR